MATLFEALSSLPSWPCGFDPVTRSDDFSQSAVIRALSRDREYPRVSAVDSAVSRIRECSEGEIRVPCVPSELLQQL